MAILLTPWTFTLLFRVANKVRVLESCSKAGSLGQEKPQKAQDEHVRGSSSVTLFQKNNAMFFAELIRHIQQIVSKSIRNRCIQHLKFDDSFKALQA